MIYSVRQRVLLYHFNSEVYCRINNSMILIYTVNSEIFANSIKRHICDEKSRTGHDLPIAVSDRVISPIRESLIFTKLRICEVSRKLNSRENFRIYSIKLQISALLLS